MPSASDRNLIVGLLAFQLDLVSKDELVVAMGKWATEKSKTLEDVFLDSGFIDHQTQQLLGSLVEKRLASSDRDRDSLLKPSADVESIREELGQLEDPDIDQSIRRVLPGKLSTAHNVTSQETIGPEAPTSWETFGPGVGVSPDGNRYRVLRPHASGGLGEVSIALDSELNRQVALKQMQSRYADDSEARQRFLVEAEITGSLEHPGVVPVYGLGIYADGRPYYAMRFIRGQSLREASDRYHQEFGSTQRNTDQKLELRKLLNAIRDVCQTMQYAHSSGILHRDVKPDNIMLGPFGETLVVDWGLAKSESDQSVAGSTGDIASSTGSRSSITATVMGSVVGTPAFMSPEQAKGQVDQISPASDVYSLGATLYYVICGRSPFGANTEVNQSSEEVGQLLQRVGRGEFARPREVDSSIPRPLAAICHKAMAVSPEDRYESCAQLGDDIERFLADEPILALVDPPLVRVQRWMRNHQTITITAAALIVASTLGLSIFSSLLTAKQNELELTNQSLVIAEQQATDAAQVAEQRRVEAEQRRSEAELARRQAEQSQASEKEAKADALAFSDFLVNNLLATARPKDVYGGLGIDITVVDAIQAAELNLTTVFAGRPRAEATARLGIGDTWYNLGEYQRAANQLTVAEELFERASGDQHIETLTARSALALSLAHLGDLEQAIQTQQQLASNLERLLGPAAPETLTARSNLALSLSQQGDYAQAIPILKEVFELSQKSMGEKDPATLRSQNNYADALRYASDDRRQQAIELLQELISSSREVVGSSHPDTLKAVNNLATLYQEMGETNRAVTMLIQTLDQMETELGADHPTTLVTKTNLAFAHVQNGQFDRAIELLHQIVEQSSGKLSPEHPSTLNAIDILAATYDSAGELELAIEYYQRSLDGRQRVLGPTHDDTLTTKNNLALAKLTIGQAEQAVELFESVLEARQGLLEPGDAQLWLSMDNLAAAYIANGQAGLALPLYRELVDHALSPADESTKWRITNNLADAYLRTDQPVAAIGILEPLFEEMQQTLNSADADLATVQQGLAIAHFRAGQWAKANQLLESVILRQRTAYAKSNADSDRSMVRGLLVYLANCQLATGDYDAAEMSARESSEIARELLPDDWRRFNAESIWGEALLRLERIEQAAPLIESSHAELLKRKSLLPRDLQLEFLVPSFDRMIKLSESRQDVPTAQDLENQKTEFLKELGL